MRFPAVRVLVGATVLAALVSACGGGPEPDPLTSTKPTTAAPSATSGPAETPSPTATAAPTPTGQSTTPGRRTQTGGPVGDALEAEVTAFVTSFMAAYDKAAVTGEFDALEKLNAPSCGGCKQNLTYLQGIYDGGGHIEGGAYTNPRIRVIGGSAKSVSVRVESTIAAYKVYKKSGAVAESEPAKADLSIFIVGRTASGSWQVTSWS